MNKLNKIRTVLHNCIVRDHLIGAALATAYVAVLLYTAPAIGLSRDEGIYVMASQAYAQWFELLADDPGVALERDTIDRYWSANHEHPPLMKSLFALSYLLDQKVGLFTRESLAFRFPGMLSAGLLLWLLYVFGTRLYGRRAGAFASLAYALLPRPFYHSHLDAFDVPITLAVTAVTYAYWRSLRDRRWALVTGALFGLALATKHNSWLLPGIYALHFAFCVLLNRTRRRLGAFVFDLVPERARPEPRPEEYSGISQGRGEDVSRSGAKADTNAPYWLIAMVLLGPPIFLGSWPWLWHDTLPRLRSYAAFHLHHEYYNIAYFGVNYFWPPFPKSYPWVMTLFTVPVTTLLVAAIGLWHACRTELAQLRSSLRGTPTADHADPWHATVLLLGSMLAPLVIFALPSTPIFGGTKHWFTAYPFMALFAGLGFKRALNAYQSWFAERSPSRLASRAHLAWPVGALLLTPALVETAHSHPFGLSHYGFAAGFVPGSADLGMNRQFWGFTTGSLVDFFDRRLPNGGKVYICDTLDASFRMLARDGLLSDRIVPTGSIADADLALVHHEHHFAEVDQQIWTTYGTTQPTYVLTYDGVPIISVYENPR